MPSGVYLRTEYHKEISRRNLSGFLESHIPWNKGLSGYKTKPASEERRRKIGEAHKGQGQTNTGRTHFKKGMIPWNKGKSEYAKGLGFGKWMKDRVGEKSNFWKGGISFDPYSSAFNEQTKDKIRVRDNFTCQLCGIPELEQYRKLDIHHIDYNKKKSELNNLIALCHKCHTKTVGNRSYWTEFFNKKVRAYAER